MKVKMRESIIALILVSVMILSFAAVAHADSYSVTAQTENLIFKGEASAVAGANYEFSFEMEEDIQIDEVYSEISGSVSLNKNSGEGESKSTTLLGTTSDDTAVPKIEMVLDEDSPMRDVLTYKRIITDSVNGNSTTTYKNQGIASFFADKPSSVSFGFWLKESDIETVYGDKPMVFWPVYKSGSYMVVNIPLSSLMSEVGVSQSIIPTTYTIENIFKSYSISAVCTARDNGWAHFVCNMDNLTYPNSFSSTGMLYYLNLSNVSTVLRENNKIEMSNLTFLVNNKIESGYIVYPYSVSDGFECAVKSISDGKYIIDKAAIKGDIAITAKGSVVTAVKEYDVTHSGTYATITGNSVAYNNEDYKFTVVPDENTEIYSIYAEVEKSVTKSKNVGEGVSSTTSFLTTTDDSTAHPKIEMVSDNDSPMSGVLPYKRVITDIINANTTTTYKNQDITSILSEKPSTISFGFWLKESDIKTVYSEKPMEFWPVYKNGSSMSVGIPLTSLMANVGVAQELTPTVKTIENVFKTYSISAVCTGRDSGWAHFVCNMENLTYPTDFSAKTSYFYLYLANVSSILRAGNKIEMSNFTFLTNDKIKSGYMVYPTASADSSFKVAPKKTEGSSYTIAKELIMGNITVNALSAIIPEEGYEPLMKCRVDGNEFMVRTSFDDETDLLQKFRGVNKNGTDANDPFDFTNAGLISKDSETMTSIERVLSSGGDEATPFKFNSSYIGANHGQSNGILVTATAHGKTYADIGSLWEDSAGVKWNLLKVVDENKLLFLSENMSTNINKYSFKNSLSGTLTYVESGENTKSITVESTQTSQQVFPSTKKLEKTIYTVINGKRYKAASGITIECDYVEVIEKYQIMNPANIGSALRAARPEGGYDAPQDLAIGTPLVNYNMIYRIMPDGTVLSIFDHEILEDITFSFYGGLQYIAKKDAFGGGVHRYIPKLASFTYSGTSYDFTEPINMTNLTYPSGFSVQMTKDLWDTDSAPDRQVDYMKNNNSEICASFAGGYLPVLDGEISFRSKNIDAAGFVYQTKKTYPYFLDSAAFKESGTKNQRIQGVAYKKYSGAADSDISYYTIPYGQDTYIYIDCHDIAEKELDFSYLINDGAQVTEIEKSSNVGYSINNGKVNVKMQSGTYGYTVLCVKSASVEPVSVIKNGESGEVVAKIKNNTHSDQSVQIITASYSGNRLESVKTENVTLKDAQTVNLKAVFEGDEVMDKVKVFVWDKISSVKPISEDIEK